jgi:hypothetical protein
VKVTRITFAFVFCKLKLLQANEQAFQGLLFYFTQLYVKYIYSWCLFRVYTFCCSVLNVFQEYLNIKFVKTYLQAAMLRTVNRMAINTQVTISQFSKVHVKRVSQYFLSVDWMSWRCSLNTVSLKLTHVNSVPETGSVCLEANKEEKFEVQILSTLHLWDIILKFRIVAMFVVIDLQYFVYSGKVCLWSLCLPTFTCPASVAISVSGPSEFPLLRLHSRFLLSYSAFPKLLFFYNFLPSFRLWSFIFNVVLFAVYSFISQSNLKRTWIIFLFFSCLFLI